MYVECAGGCEEADYYDALEARLHQMVYFAHKELLYQKIKERVERDEGKNLDRIVDLLMENAQTQSDLEKETDQKSEELKNKLRELFD